MNFSGFQKITSRIFPSTISSSTYKSTSAVLYTYEDILLKLYIDIAKTGDFTKLVKSGESGNDELILAWENLIKRQQKETGSNQYNAFFGLSKAYLIYLNDYNLIRACLILIGINNIYPDLEYVQILKEKGYNIDTSSPQSVIDSVNAGLHRCSNLITKATSKRKELDSMTKGSDSPGEAPGFEQILANLNIQLGFNVDENLTLARYNEYQKILKARNKPK